MGPISLFQHKELISHTTPPPSNRVVFDLPVLLKLTERRIYLYLEALQSAAANFIVDAEVQLFNGNEQVAVFPATISDLGTTPAGSPALQSPVSMFTSGGAPVGDSVVVSLYDPFDITTPVYKVTVQPLRINCEISSIRLYLKAVAGSNLTGFRAWLGCLSTKIG